MTPQQCPGCQSENVVVEYIDRRSPAGIVYYYDKGADGILDAVQYGEYHPSGGGDGHGYWKGAYDWRLEIVETINEVDRWSALAASAGWKDNRVWVTRLTANNRPYQAEYNEVRATYQKLHPTEEFSENKKP
jgi:hypothetical protein